LSLPLSTSRTVSLASPLSLPLSSIPLSRSFSLPSSPAAPANSAADYPRWLRFFQRPPTEEEINESKKESETRKKELEDKYTPQQIQNYNDWSRWYRVRDNALIVSLTILLFFIVRYWKNETYEHFTYHRWEPEPYPFYLERKDVTGANWWPGRHCQFFELNCYAKVYQEADRLLAIEKQKLKQEKGKGKGKESKQKEHH